MDIWILVLAFLVIAIILLFASLFAKDSQDYQEMDDSFNEHQQKLSDLQGQIKQIERDIYEEVGLEDNENLPNVSSLTADQVYHNSTNPADSDITVKVADQSGVSTEVVDERPTVNMNITERTREEIIRFYSQGYTVNEIAKEVNEQAETVQYFIDEYIENR